jgi:N utilization substance protein A
MARKAAVPVMDTKTDLVERLGEFSNFKNIDRATLMSVLEDIFRSMIRKRYGTDENFNVIINVERGDIQAFRERKIVEDGAVEDESVHIALSDALKIDEDYEVGDDVAEEVSFNDFGRRQVMAAKQLLAQRIKELEKNLVFDHYKELIGEIIIGEVYQVWRNEILVMHDNNELILPKQEQIPKDKYKKGDTIRAVVLDVEMRNGTPRVIISRSSPKFLERYFEMEVPEIDDGLITIKGIVRDPGERAKVAVESYDDRIDPVGACVGMRGSRIHGIVRELRNENIDVINFSPNSQIYIQRALSPARVSSMVVDEARKHASVYLKPDQISLAIGKGGQNVKLASKLTGYELDIFREATADEQVEEDVDLDEFTDEIEEWVIEELKGIGLDTAKSVLRLSVEELERRTSLEREVIEELLAILRKEFED